MPAWLLGQNRLGSTFEEPESSSGEDLQGGESEEETAEAEEADEEEPQTAG